MKKTRAAIRGADHAATAVDALLDRIGSLANEAGAMGLGSDAALTTLTSAHANLTLDTDIKTLPGNYQPYFKLRVSSGSISKRRSKSR